MKLKNVFSLLISAVASVCLVTASQPVASADTISRSVGIDYSKFDIIKSGVFGGYLRGDINFDDKIDSKDAVEVLKYYAAVIAGKNPLKSGLNWNIHKGDMNGDNLIDSKDAVCILQFYAESIVSNNFDNVVTIATTYWSGHKYILYDGVNSGRDAMIFCYKKGGYLACIGNKAENDFLYKWILDNNQKNAYFGYTDTFLEGNWVWMDWTTSYSNWHSNEPNSENSQEDFAMFYWKFSDGTWNDGDFGHNTNSGGTAFICEIY